MRKEIITLVSDISGEPADETVQFGLDGATYEIDLTTSQASSLRKSLASYTDSARRVGGRRKPTKTHLAQAPASKEERAAIRVWARENGHEVSERARIPKAISKAYYAAQGA